jgi:hypothetical protein
MQLTRLSLVNIVLGKKIHCSFFKNINNKKKEEKKRAYLQ